jgi:hypothetical protein
MNRKFVTTRLGFGCLILSALLVLGIVQWSFLPILVQSGSVTGGAVVEMSAGHTSKFAAPFKYLFGDPLKPSLAQAALSAPMIAHTFIPLSGEPLSHRDDLAFTRRQLRAPPCV